MVLRPKTEIILPHFLFAFLTLQSTLNELQHLAESRSGTFPQITFSSEVVPMPILVPAFEIQERIIAIADSITSAIQNNVLINDNLVA